MSLLVCSCGSQLLSCNGCLINVLKWKIGVRRRKVKRKCEKELASSKKGEKRGEKKEGREERRGK